MKDYPGCRARSREGVSRRRRRVDEQDATNAEHFYRCVIIRGPMTLSTNISAVESHLQRLLAKYQPDARTADAIERANADTWQQPG